jgi:hypothetical protein
MTGIRCALDLYYFARLVGRNRPEIPSHGPTMSHVAQICIVPLRWTLGCYLVRFLSLFEKKEVH